MTEDYAIHSSPVQRPETAAERQLRVKSELIAAGASSYALRKFNSRYLPTIIHGNEHIMRVIYGRYSEGFGFLSMVDRMVVATDRRIISLNHKPGFTNVNEFTYDVVEDIDRSMAGPFTSITIVTTATRFTVQYVKNRPAARFMRYVQERRTQFFESNK